MNRSLTHLARQVPVFMSFRREDIIISPTLLQLQQSVHSPGLHQCHEYPIHQFLLSLLSIPTCPVVQCCLLTLLVLLFLIVLVILFSTLPFQFLGRDVTDVRHSVMESGPASRQSSTTCDLYFLLQYLVSLYTY